MLVVKEELKVRLKKAMQSRNITQAELARRTGLSRSAINQYLSGYTMPKSDRIYLLAKALDVSEAWLMGFDVPINMKKIMDVNVIDGDYQISISSYSEEDLKKEKLLRLFNLLNSTQKETIINLLESMVGDKQ